MSDYPMLISNKLHSFRNFMDAKIQLIREKTGSMFAELKMICTFAPLKREVLLEKEVLERWQSGRLRRS